MSRYDGFRHSRHSHGVGADGADVAVLGGRFVIGAGDGGIHSRVKIQFLPGGNFLRHADELFVVHLAHVGKTRPQAFVVGACQRVVAAKVDVVADDHDVAHVIVGIGATAGVGKKQMADTQKLEHPHRKGYLLHGIAFVKVESSFEDYHRHFVDGPEDEGSLVSFDGGNGEVRDFLIRYAVCYFYLTDEIAQAGAEDDPDLRLKIGSIAEVCYCLLYLIVHNCVFVH